MSNFGDSLEGSRDDERQRRLDLSNRMNHHLMGGSGVESWLRANADDNLMTTSDFSVIITKAGRVGSKGPKEPSPTDYLVPNLMNPTPQPLTHMTPLSLQPPTYLAQSSGTSMPSKPGKASMPPPPFSSGVPSPPTGGGYGSLQNTMNITVDEHYSIKERMEGSKIGERPAELLSPTPGEKHSRSPSQEQKPGSSRGVVQQKTTGGVASSSGTQGHQRQPQPMSPANQLETMSMVSSLDDVRTQYTSPKQLGRNVAGLMCGSPEGAQETCEVGSLLGGPGGTSGSRKMSGVSSSNVQMSGSSKDGSKERPGYEQKLRQLENRLREHEEGKGQMAEQLKTLQAEKAKLDAERRTWEQKLKALQAAKKRQEEQHRNLSEQHRKSETEMVKHKDTLIQERKKHRASVVKMQKQHQEEKEKLIDELKVASQKYGTEQAPKAELMAKLTDMRLQKQKVEGKCKSQDVIIKNLRSDLEELRNSSSADDLNAAHAQIEELNRQLEALNVANAELHRTVEDQERAMSDLKTQSENQAVGLSNEHEAKYRGEIRDLQAKLQEQLEENTRLEIAKEQEVKKTQLDLQNELRRQEQELSARFSARLLEDKSVIQQQESSFKQQLEKAIVDTTFKHKEELRKLKAAHTAESAVLVQQRHTLNMKLRKFVDHMHQEGESNLLLQDETGKILHMKKMSRDMEVGSDLHAVKAALQQTRTALQAGNERDDSVAEDVIAKYSEKEKITERLVDDIGQYFVVFLRAVKAEKQRVDELGERVATSTSRIASTESSLQDRDISLREKDTQLGDLRTKVAELEKQLLDETAHSEAHSSCARHARERDELSVSRRNQLQTAMDEKNALIDKLQVELAHEKAARIERERSLQQELHEVQEVQLSDLGDMRRKLLHAEDERESFKIELELKAKKVEDYEAVLAKDKQKAQETVEKLERCLEEKEQTFAQEIEKYKEEAVKHKQYLDTEVKTRKSERMTLTNKFKAKTEQLDKENARLSTILDEERAAWKQEQKKTKEITSKQFSEKQKELQKVQGQLHKQVARAKQFQMNIREMERVVLEGNAGGDVKKVLQEVTSEKDRRMDQLLCEHEDRVAQLEAESFEKMSLMESFIDQVAAIEERLAETEHRLEDAVHENDRLRGVCGEKRDAEILADEIMEQLTPKKRHLSKLTSDATSHIGSPPGSILSTGQDVLNRPSQTGPVSFTTRSPTRQAPGLARTFYDQLHKKLEQGALKTAQKDGGTNAYLLEKRKALARDLYHGSFLELQRVSKLLSRCLNQPGSPSGTSIDPFGGQISSQDSHEDDHVDTMVEVKKKHEFESLLKRIGNQSDSLFIECKSLRENLLNAEAQVSAGKEREAGMCERLKEYIEIQQNRDADLVQLESESNEMRTLVADYKGQLAMYHEQLNESDRTLTDLIEHSTEAERSLQETIEKLTQEKTNLESKMQELQKTREEDSVENLRTMQEMKAEHHEHVEGTRRRYREEFEAQQLKYREELEAVHGNYRTKIEHLESAHHEHVRGIHEQHSETLKTVTDQHEDSFTRTRDLDRQEAERRQKEFDDKVTKTEGERDALKTQVDELTASNKELIESVAKYQRQCEEQLRVNNDRVDSLQALIQQVTEQKEGLEEQLKQAKESAAKDRDAFDEQKNELLRNLQEKVDKIHEKHTTERQDLLDRKDDLEKALRGEIEKHKSEKSKLKDHLNGEGEKWQQKLNVLKADKDAAEHQQELLQKKVDRLESLRKDEQDAWQLEKSRMETQLNLERAENKKKLEDKIEHTMQDALIKNREDVMEHQLHIETKNKKVTRLQDELLEKDREIAKLQTELDTAHKDQTKLTSEIRNMEREKTRMQDAADDERRRMSHVFDDERKRLNSAIEDERKAKNDLLVKVTNTAAQLGGGGGGLLGLDGSKANPDASMVGNNLRELVVQLQSGAGSFDTPGKAAGLGLSPGPRLFRPTLGLYTPSPGGVYSRTGGAGDGGGERSGLLAAELDRSNKTIDNLRDEVGKLNHELKERGKELAEMEVVQRHMDDIQKEQKIVNDLLKRQYEDAKEKLHRSGMRFTHEIEQLRRENTRSREEVSEVIKKHRQDVKEVVKLVNERFALVTQRANLVKYQPSPHGRHSPTLDRPDIITEDFDVPLVDLPTFDEYERQFPGGNINVQWPEKGLLAPLLEVSCEDDSVSPQRKRSRSPRDPKVAVQSTSGFHRSRSPPSSRSPQGNGRGHTTPDRKTSSPKSPAMSDEHMEKVLQMVTEAEKDLQETINRSKALMLEQAKRPKSPPPRGGSDIRITDGKAGNVLISSGDGSSTGFDILINSNENRHKITATSNEGQPINVKYASDDMEIQVRSRSPTPRADGSSDVEVQVKRSPKSPSTSTGILDPLMAMEAPDHLDLGSARKSFREASALPKVKKLNKTNLSTLNAEQGGTGRAASGGRAASSKRSVAASSGIWGRDVPMERIVVDGHGTVALSPARSASPFGGRNEDDDLSPMQKLEKRGEERENRVRPWREKPAKHNPHDQMSVSVFSNADQKPAWMPVGKRGIGYFDAQVSGVYSRDNSRSPGRDRSSDVASNASKGTLRSARSSPSRNPYEHVQSRYLTPPKEGRSDSNKPRSKGTNLSSVAEGKEPTKNTGKTKASTKSKVSLSPKRIGEGASPKGVSPSNATPKSPSLTHANVKKHDKNTETGNHNHKMDRLQKSIKQDQPPRSNPERTSPIDERNEKLLDSIRTSINNAVTGSGSTPQGGSESRTQDQQSSRSREGGRCQSSSPLSPIHEAANSDGSHKRLYEHDSRERHRDHHHRFSQEQRQGSSSPSPQDRQEDGTQVCGSHQSSPKHTAHVEEHTYRGHDPKAIFNLAEQLCEERRWSEAGSMFEKVLAAVEEHGEPRELDVMEVVTSIDRQHSFHHDNTGTEAAGGSGLARDVIHSQKLANHLSSLKKGVEKMRPGKTNKSFKERMKEVETTRKDVQRLIKSEFDNSSIGPLDVAMHAIVEEAMVSAALNRTFKEVSEAEVFAHLGVVNQSMDKVEEAIKNYEAAASLDPSLHVCFANLASLFIYLGDLKKASTCIDRAVMLDPANVVYAEIASELLRNGPIQK